MTRRQVGRLLHTIFIFLTVVECADGVSTSQVNISSNTLRGKPLHFSQIVIIDEKGTNVATSSSCTSRSFKTWNDSRSGAVCDNVIDGTLSVRGNPNPYYHSKDEGTTEWVLITLRKETDVRELRIYNRDSSDCCENYLKNSKIELMSSGSTVASYTSDGSQIQRITVPPTSNDDTPRIVSDDVLNALDVFSTSANIGLGIGSVGAFAGSTALSSMGLLCVINQNIWCESRIPDSIDLERLLNPVKLPIRDVPRAGAVVFNMLLIAGFCIFLLLNSLLISCGYGSWKEGSSLLRVPSILFMGFMLFFAAIFESSADLIGNSRGDPSLVVIGVSGFIFLIIFLIFLWLIGRTSCFKSEIVHNTNIISSAGKYFFGNSGWASMNLTCLHTERYGVIFDCYSQSLLDHGRFIFIEIGIAIPLCLLSMAQPSNNHSCAVRTWSMGLIYFVYAGVCLYFRPFLAPFLNHLTPFMGILPGLGLIFHGIAQFSGNPYDHWGTVIGIYLMLVGMIVGFVRILYDIFRRLCEIFLSICDKPTNQANCKRGRQGKHDMTRSFVHSEASQPLHQEMHYYQQQQQQQQLPKQQSVDDKVGEFSCKSPPSLPSSSTSDIPIPISKTGVSFRNPALHGFDANCPPHDICNDLVNNKNVDQSYLDEAIQSVSQFRKQQLRKSSLKNSDPPPEELSVISVASTISAGSYYASF